MIPYSSMTDSQRQAEYSRLQEAYAACKAKGLKLDMSRGKPAATQLQIAMDFLDVIDKNKFYYLLLDRTTVIVDRMKEHRNPDSFAREQVEYFVAHGLMSTVLRWHHFGFQSTPEEMAKVFGRLLASTDASVARLLL